MAIFNLWYVVADGATVAEWNSWCSVDEMSDIGLTKTYAPLF